ncbi:MFS transporter [Vibrio hepatarius]|uniref:MFS transporter n=1 Tax=Vibrio hepatarius TaxID=171383 RepID=UPI001C084EC4|nr:MFS transporter [Vibrio hepatarius]MBU2897654.1 MFS transporter [Vibrio hepatarius]
MIELRTNEYRRVIFTLALGSFVVFCNLYLFQPMLPYMAAHFAVTETQINWLFAATTLVLSFSLVPWAVVSETIGRKQVMVLGLFSMPVISIGMLWSPSLINLIVMRAMMGVAIAAFASVAVAYMAEELSPKAFNQAIGGYIAANSLGGISGRVIGGTLTDAFGWEQAVIAMAIITCFGALIVMTMLPTQRHFSPQGGMLRFHNRAVIKHFKNKTIMLAMLIGGINFALFVNLYSVMGFRLVEVPHSLPIGLASLIFFCYLPGTISSKLTSIWNRHYHPILGMVVGTSISLVGMLVAYVDHMPWMVLGLCLISFGAFFTHTLAYAWVSQKSTTAKATATALYLVHYYVGGSLGGFLLIYCWQHGGWLFVMSGGLILYLVIYVLCYQLRQDSIDGTALTKLNRLQQ